MTWNAEDRLIVALDVPSADEALRAVDRLEGTCRWFKVGMELFYAAGRQVVEELVRREMRVFLDLKLHDIPATVAGAVRSVSEMGASLLTLHAGGGGAMMEAAAEAAARPGAPRLLAVTVLTSLDEQALTAVGVRDGVAAQVLRLARLASGSGIDGMVCSAAELLMLRREMGSEPLLVVPGVRPVGSASDDQRRIATPREALARGASMLVVGRPILQAKDPARVAAEILESMVSDQSETMDPGGLGGVAGDAESLVREAQGE